MNVLGLTPEDAIEYISSGGKFKNVGSFKAFCENNHLRLGQCWFQSLSPVDRNKLSNTRWDPYEGDEWTPILAALAYLLDSDSENSIHAELVERYLRNGWN